MPRFIFPGEEIEWGNDIREVGDEFVIEVGESGEQPNSFYSGGWFPFFDHFKFFCVHFYFALSNDHSQELHFWGIEDSFG